ncbi:hypothetical protein JCM3770_004757 [Rhodotorula araucariae]
MATLKSALRFPPPPAEPQRPNLTSRFSAETLVSKSPPRPFQRLFSSTNASASPPQSPPAGTVRRYHRRVPSQKGIHRHAPSASESRLAVSSRVADDLPDTPTRPSMDDARPQPCRTGSISRARATSGTAADKLAGAAKEVLDKFARMRHGRHGSHSSAHSASDESVEELASPRRSRSLSSPSPGPHQVQDHHPPPPTRPLPPRPLSPPFTLVELPPRSDSRNAMAAGFPSLNASSQAARLPTLAATRPRPKHLALQPPPPPRPQLRPIAPPSPSVPPFRPAPAAPIDSVGKPFHALLAKLPTREAVRTRTADELLVRIDVGGRSTYITSAATLVSEGAQAGRLGEFVEAVLEDVRRGRPPMPVAEPREDDPVLEDTRAPSLMPSPHPFSPFPFADNMSTFSDCPQDGLGLGLDEDPMSPIDPLVNSAAAAYAAKDLVLVRLPAFGPPPHPLPVQHQAQAVQLVASPTLPHGGKHRSMYPDVGSSVDLDVEGAPLLPFVVPAGAAGSLAEEAAKRALAMRLRRAFSSRRGSNASSASADARDDEIRLVSSFQCGLGPYFDVVRHQLHSPAADSLLSPCWPNDSCVSPSSASSPITTKMQLSPRAVERHSLDYGLLPSDVEGYGSEEEHRSRSTVLGIPRGLSLRTLAALHALPAARVRDDAMPEAPQLPVEQDKARDDKSRTGTPSLSSSLTTVDDGDDEVESGMRSSVAVSLEDTTLAIFLDRTDASLLSLSLASDGHAQTSIAPGLTLYEAILTFVRTDALPVSLLLPRPASPPAKPATPDIDPLYLSLFALSPTPLFALLSALRTLSAEAAWLGLGGLERACADELARVGGVVHWLAEAKDGIEANKGRTEANKGRTEAFRVATREKEGWI